jgi:hypothetical protein
MNKREAIKALGGRNVTAARAIGISPSAVSQWPDELSAAVADRVVAAMLRMRAKKAKSARRNK